MGRPLKGAPFSIEIVPAQRPRSRAHSLSMRGAHRAVSLAITTVVLELLSLGKSRFGAMRILRRGRSPRMIGQ